MVPEFSATDNYHCFISVPIWYKYTKHSIQFHPCQFIFHMNYIIEGEGALVNEKGEETLLNAGDFVLVNPDEKHQYCNKGDKPFKMICGVPKEFE